MLHTVRRIGLPFALALLAGVAVISYRTVVQFRNDVEWRGHTHQVLEHIERANTALLGADSSRRAYRLSRDRRDLDEMQARVDVSTRELATIEELTADNPGQQQRLRELRPVVAERLEVLHDGLELPSWDQLDAKTREEQHVRQSHGSDLARRVGLQIDAMRDEEVRLLDEREQRAALSAGATQRTLVYGSALGMGLVALFYGSLLQENRKRRRAQQDLAHANALFNAVLVGTTDVIAVKDKEGRYLLVNPAGCQNLGRPQEAILGKTDRDLLTGGTGASVMEGDAEVLRLGETRTYEQVASVGDRTWTFSSTKGPYKSATGELLGVIAVSRDITEWKRMELANLELRETLRSQAIRDPLTNLFNRRYMDETLVRELSRVKRKEAPLSVIMIDVDHFKRLNDTAGHAAGDEVLRRVAEELASAVRREDVACRYGGEEFALIMPELTIEGAVERAEKLRRAVEDLFVEVGGRRVGPVTASFGVACYPMHGSSGEALLQVADEALYRAKTGGRNRVVAADMPEPAARRDSIAAAAASTRRVGS